MPKISDEPLKVIQIRIFAKDDQRLKTLFGGSGVKINKILRTLIRTFLNQTEAKVQARIDAEDIMEDENI
jgi:hypothetical protein